MFHCTLTICVILPLAGRRAVPIPAAILLNDSLILRQGVRHTSSLSPSVTDSTSFSVRTLSFLLIFCSLLFFSWLPPRPRFAVIVLVNVAVVFPAGPVAPARLAGDDAAVPCQGPREERRGRVGGGGGVLSLPYPHGRIRRRAPVDRAQKESYRLFYFYFLFFCFFIIIIFIFQLRRERVVRAHSVALTVRVALSSASTRGRARATDVVDACWRPRYQCLVFHARISHMCTRICSHSAARETRLSRRCRWRQWRRTREEAVERERSNGTKIKTREKGKKQRESLQRVCIVKRRPPRSHATISPRKNHTFDLFARHCSAFFIDTSSDSSPGVAIRDFAVPSLSAFSD